MLALKLSLSKNAHLAPIADKSSAKEFLMKRSEQEERVAEEVSARHTARLLE